MRYIFTFLSLIFIINFGFSQTDITFRLANYNQDSLVIGYYYGDKTLVKDTLGSIDKSTFHLKQDEALEPGVYLALFMPSNEYIQFLVPAEDQVFEINYTVDSPENAICKGSTDNEVFYEYLNFLQKKQPERQALQDKLATDESNQAIQDQIKAIDQSVKDKQNEIVLSYPNSLSAALLKSSFQIDIPKYPGLEGDALKLQEYHYYKDHYFEHIDLGFPPNLRTPFLFERVDYYINKLVPQHPDSISIAIDKILTQMEPAEETYKYYLSHFLNNFANSKIIGFDAIYVHLALNYYAKGKASWVAEEQLVKIIENARLLEPILIGKTAPNLTLYRKDGTEINIHDINSKYTVLLFWAPSCGHCKKAMPELKEFYQKYKGQGVEVLAICTKHREQVKDCWDMIEDKELQWINVVDTYHRSNFREVYNIKSTPRIFILDQDKKIVLKRVPTENLESIMEQLIQDMDKAIIEGAEPEN